MKSLDRFVIAAVLTGLVVLSLAAGLMFWAANRYLPEEAYDGLLMVGFEVQDFKPFGSADRGECWSVDDFASAEVLARFEAALPPDVRQQGVVPAVVLRFAFRGNRTATRGWYGHLGMNPHAVRVNEIVTIAPWQPGAKEPPRPKCK